VKLTGSPKHWLSQIDSINSIKEKQSMFTVGLFLRVRWLDVRLRYDVASMGTLGLITLNDADEVSPCHTREPRSTDR